MLVVGVLMVLYIGIGCARAGVELRAALRRVQCCS
jgi:hypothetical protein